ncbi:hypothetical protein NVP1144O_18 [Vibrio phage 1.144.O._10N.286.45.B3]|nr:hypothetical protein NVP1144O_18 [Vibrio phage 1.144.O._10N.286.45.B3]
MSDYMERMMDEEGQLKVRVNGLRSFIQSNEIFETLPRDEKYRMIKQLSGMEVYLKALSERLMVASGNF